MRRNQPLVFPLSFHARQREPGSPPADDSPFPSLSRRATPVGRARSSACGRMAQTRCVPALQPCLFVPPSPRVLGEFHAQGNGVSTTRTKQFGLQRSLTFVFASSRGLAVTLSACAFVSCHSASQCDSCLAKNLVCTYVLPPPRSDAHLETLLLTTLRRVLARRS